MTSDDREKVARSFEMLLAAYYLSRCGVAEHAKASKPPAELNVTSWKECYDLFFDSMGDGREQRQFQNSMKNARDTFDVLFDNGRIGWVDVDGHQPELPLRFHRIHQEWVNRPDAELEGFVLKLLTGGMGPDTATGAVARTEGGLRSAFQGNESVIQN